MCALSFLLHIPIKNTTTTPLQQQFDLVINFVSSTSIQNTMYISVGVKSGHMLVPRTDNCSLMYKREFDIVHKILHIYIIPTNTVSGK